MSRSDCDPTQCGPAFPRRISGQLTIKLTLFVDTEVARLTTSRRWPSAEMS